MDQLAYMSLAKDYRDTQVSIGSVIHGYWITLSKFLFF